MTQEHIIQVCVQLPTYADNVALPAFTGRCCNNRSKYPARRAHNSNLQQRIYSYYCGPLLGQTDGQTDGHRTVS